MKEAYFLLLVRIVNREDTNFIVTQKLTKTQFSASR